MAHCQTRGAAKMKTKLLRLGYACVCVFLCRETIATAAVSDCDDGQYSCNNVETGDHMACIPDAWRCDGVIHCPEYDDEDGCPENHVITRCYSDRFYCHANHSCIPGVYRCDLKDDCPDGEDEMSCTAPTILERPNTITVEPGQTARLVCGVGNIGDAMVIWRRSLTNGPLSVGESVFNPDPRYTVSARPSEHDYILEIADARPSDAGMYQCWLSEPMVMGFLVELRVREPTPTFLPRPQTIEVRPGDTVDLKCGIPNDGFIIAAWTGPGDTLLTYIDNRIIDDPRVTVFTNSETNDYVLRIALVQTHDAGTYHCLVPGDDETRTFPVELRVSATATTK